MPPCWLVAVAALLVVPVAIVIRVYVRPVVSAVVQGLKTQVGAGELAKHGDQAFASILKHPLWLKGIMWAGSLSTPAAIGLVVAIALSVFCLGACAQRACCPPQSAQPTFQPKVRRKATPNADKEGKTQEEGGDTMEVDLDPAQAKVWDGELEGVMADLREVEATLEALGLPLEHPDPHQEEEEGQQADKEGSEGALPHMQQQGPLRQRPVRSQAPQ